MTNDLNQIDVELYLYSGPGEASRHLRKAHKVFVTGGGLLLNSKRTNNQTEFQYIPNHMIHAARWFGKEHAPRERQE